MGRRRVRACGCTDEGCREAPGEPDQKESEHIAEDGGRGLGWWGGSRGLHDERLRAVQGYIAYSKYLFSLSSRTHTGESRRPAGIDPW